MTVLSTSSVSFILAEVFCFFWHPWHSQGQNILFYLSLWNSSIVAPSSYFFNLLSSETCKRGIVTIFCQNFKKRKCYFQCMVILKKFGTKIPVCFVLSLFRPSFLAVIEEKSLKLMVTCTRSGKNEVACGTWLYLFRIMFL